MSINVVKHASKRLTRKERSRRPATWGLVVAVSTLVGGAVGGAASGAAAACVLAIAGAAAALAVLLARDLGQIRTTVSEVAAVQAMEPFRDGEIYPLNPATLCPENALTLCQEIIYRRPQRVLELGSGSSTVLVSRCLQYLGAEGRTLVSLDHHEYWHKDTQNKIDRLGLGTIATVLHAPLVTQDGLPAPWYDLSVLPADAGPFDLILVDGPEGKGTARFGAFPQLRKYLARDAVLLLDDGLRDGETEVVRLWQEIEPRLRVDFVPSVNGLWRVATEPQASD
ncbi:MAG: class I SAM-dependent methyltransferase [Planctomycetota bacterium]